MIDEGYIKFNCVWDEVDTLTQADVAELNIYRQKLRTQGLIGVYPDGIGYGNISRRDSQSIFVISGSATGGYARMHSADYARVTRCDTRRNSVWCTGGTKASSESMTHCILYVLDERVQGVIHVHDKALWQQLLYKVPTTAEDVSYGTPEMSDEVERLWRESDLCEQKIFAMAGHEEGIVTFGHSLEEAYRVLLQKIWTTTLVY